MNLSKNRMYWLIWALGSIALIAYLTTTLLAGDDKTLFTPGEMTGGHHQMGISCDSCHTKPFTEKEDFQEACMACHGDIRKKPFDSHPANKFKDPRNASLLEQIDATQCITCHAEHNPEITSKGGFTQPQDFCIHCHADVGEERESHKDMSFMTCNDAGCHNFHDNRAIYTDFLLKHLEDSDLLSKHTLDEKDFASRLEEIATYPHKAFPVKKVGAEDISESASRSLQKAAHTHTGIMNDWLTTKHAKSGVTCDACHMQEVTSELSTSEKDNNEKVELSWVDKPDTTSCATCHDIETKHFTEGKHGMRLKVGLSPMTPAHARLPMHQDSIDKPLNCVTCHSAHAFDVKKAAVDGCLQCHADDHSMAYQDSKHFELWQKELSGELPKGSGVSCASCHMPRVELEVSGWMERVVVMHNQNFNLVPNEKMIRPVCMNCHGLEFSINAISDVELVKKNFNGTSTFKTDSMRLVDEEQKRYEEKQRKRKEAKALKEKQAAQKQATEKDSDD